MYEMICEKVGFKGLVSVEETENFIRVSQASRSYIYNKNSGVITQLY